MDTLTCHSLYKAFDGILALDNVTLVMPSAGITAIIGPNGAGKTTFLNVLTGFVRADSGEVRMGRHIITRWPQYRIARLGIARTFQEVRLIQHMSAVENVMLAQPNRYGENVWRALIGNGVKQEEATRRESAMAYLRFVGLEDRHQDNASELSYGQQKLLTLAACLATEAAILLLDEPVAGVDPPTVEKMLSLMIELKRKGKLVIFVEHDINAVRFVADCVIVMDEGSIIAHGPPSEVLERPEIMEAYIG